MDMTPPQAPPAVVSSTQQEAIDALQRLTDAQTWLGRQQDALPVLPASLTIESRDAYLAGLDAYWRQSVDDAPGTAPVTRVAALATRLAAIMRDEAIVRRSDDTLGTLAVELATRFARSADGLPPPGMEARSLLIGDVACAGAVVLLDSNHPDIVLRFLPDRGWDAFASLEQLHAQTETMMRERLAAQRKLPGLRADDTQRVIANGRFVGSAPIEGPVFDAMAQSLVALQRSELTDAWPSSTDAPTPEAVADETSSALDLSVTVDVFAILGQRETRLAVALNEERLARVPADVAQGWRDAVSAYRHASARSGDATRQDGEAPSTLATWTRTELASALASRGFPIDPDDIGIEASGSEALTVPALGTAPADPVTRMSLAAFALRNTGHIDARRLRVVSTALPDGVRAPDIATIRDIARRLDLAPRYEAYLRARMSDPAGRAFRQSTMRLQQARMRVEAASARMATYLRGETPVFLDDHEERGYRLVEAVLDAPSAAARRRVGGHRVTVRQLVYRGAAVSDVLIIGVHDPASSPRVVIYTPDAPDGRPFHEFSDRATAGRQLFYAKAFEQYLLQRLPAEFSEPVPQGGGRRFRISEATRRSHWVLSAAGDGRGTLTEARFEERDVDGDVRTALFDAEVERQARDVAWIGRSTDQADRESITATLAVVLRAFRGPEALVEDSLSAVGQALRATWRFYDNVKAGDRHQAFVDFTEAYTASLHVAGWGAGFGKVPRPRLSLRPPAGGLRSLDAGLRLTDTRQRLDPRYATRDVDLSGIPSDALGVHRLHGRRYIRQQESVFEVRHDAASGTWRLARPNALDAAFAGPAIEPVAYGGWRLRTGVGLRGGWVDDAAFPQPASRGVTGQELAGLSDFQRWTFEQSFAQRLRSAGEANLIVWDVTSQPHPRFVTLRQRTAWNDALRTARGAPTEPLPLGTQPGPGASWRVLSPGEWPNSLFHYPAGFYGALGNGSQVIPLQVSPGTGLRGLPATRTPPAARVAGMATGNVPGARSQEWVEVHLDRYRHRPGPNGRPTIRVIEDRRGAEITYVIQPDTGFSINFLGLEPGDFTAGRQALP
ncbi:DUF6543 domain-containing protein [Luteibacter sp. 9133]|uniref:dermonecrotic toxin domain-containing protein n=1 Tax=Luteibacter sp. 9133 TaxID=1500891 RepID=UPI0005BD47F5|nr:DUF6543 domain-containing protein [Luteibacter sp. 9133]